MFVVPNHRLTTIDNVPLNELGFFYTFFNEQTLLIFLSVYDSFAEKRQ
jgi:hypothetical protein